MIRASVSHTTNHLSALLGQVKAGEVVLITEREFPIAQIVPVTASISHAQIESLARLRPKPSG
jgi:antitoxin (DNA-binding transcriptional repressor) of toxin-antitoxin stability system